MRPNQEKIEWVTDLETEYEDESWWMKERERAQKLCAINYK